MIKVPLTGIHEFRKTKDFTQHDRLETFDQLQCTNCRMIGRKLNREPFVYVSDTYSQERIEQCKRDNFIDKYLGKQIQIICKIKGNEEFNQILIYSVHTIVKPPIGKINGEQGYWIMGDYGNPIKILFDECIEYPLHPIKHLIRTRTKSPVIKSKRTCQPIIKRKRTN